MIPLHCLWAKWNNRTRSQFECDVTWFCFCLDFVRSNASYGCWSIVCWKGWGIRLKLEVQGPEGVGKILDVNGQGLGSWKLDNFHGRHMCIVPKFSAGKESSMWNPLQLHHFNSTAVIFSLYILFPWIGTTKVFFPRICIPKTLFRHVEYLLKVNNKK